MTKAIINSKLKTIIELADHVYSDEHANYYLNVYMKQLEGLLIGEPLNLDSLSENEKALFKRAEQHSFKIQTKEEIYNELMKQLEEARLAYNEKTGEK